MIYGDMQKAWDVWFRIFHAAFAEAGLSMNPEEFRPFCKNFFEQPEPAVLQDEFTVVERRMHALAASVGVKGDREKFRQAIEESITSWHDYVHLDPEAIPLLAEIKTTRPLVLVSNFDYAPHVNNLIEQLGISGLFNTLVVSDAVGVKKPDRAIFDIALERVGLHPSEVIHVGDSPEDIDGALAAGIRPLWIDRSGNHTADRPTWKSVPRINSLRQVLTYLE